MALRESKKVRERIKSRNDISFTRQIFRGIIRIGIIAILITATYYVTRLPIVTITGVTVIGGETISHDEIRSRVQDELNGTYFLIIPKQFSYLYPHDRMMNVLEKVSRIHSIQIERASRNELLVTFAEYIPHALWCMYGKEKQPCYFIDKEGYAFAEAPLLHGGTLTRHIIEEVNELSKGMVIDAEQLTRIDAFIERVEKELNFRVTALIHRKNKDYEFIVNGGGMIFVASENDLTTTFENLKSVLTSKEFKHIAPGNFKYVDVRFDNKVFVNEELQPLSTTTETTDTLPQ